MLLLYRSRKYDFPRSQLGSKCAWTQVSNITNLHSSKIKKTIWLSFTLFFIKMWQENQLWVFFLGKWNDELTSITYEHISQRIHGWQSVICHNTVFETTVLTWQLTLLQLASFNHRLIWLDSSLTHMDLLNLAYTSPSLSYCHSL